MVQPSERRFVVGAIGAGQELKPADSQHMLTALITGLLILPVLAFYTALNHDAVTLLALINYHLGGSAPNFDIDHVIDPIAVFVFPFLDASCEISHNVAAVKAAQRWV